MTLKPQIFFAPLQGLTDFHFRNAYQKYFCDVDQFYSPWIKLDGAGNIKKSQLRDVSIENNKEINLVPQIMCNKPEDFISLANYLHKQEYEEINWNLGCPHPMITKRGMGAALLSQPEKVVSILENILPRIFNKLSIKIRLGFEDENDSLKLLPLLNNLPITEIIIHARTAKQMYKGNANLDAFENCLAASKHKLVYNGDIDSFQKYLDLKTRFPLINKWMIGRGLIANPFLAGMIKNDSDQLPLNHRKIFEEFHQELLENCASHLSGEKHLLTKMLGYWQYFSLSFTEAQKVLKRIKKAKTLVAYNEAVNINLKNGFGDRKDVRF